MFKSIDTFLDGEGRIVSWPSKRRAEHRLAILDRLTGLFEPGRVYSADDVSNLLQQHAAADLVPTLVGELVDGDYLAQDDRGYWRADTRPEMGQGLAAEEQPFS